MFDAGTITREQFDALAVAINTGTNIPSVATPNGQAAFLFLLTSALAPLILANVLVNNLIARGRMGIAPWLAAIAGAYGVTLAALRTRLPGMETFHAFKTVVALLGAFSFLMFLAALWFTLADNRRTDPDPAPTANQAADR